MIQMLLELLKVFLQKIGVYYKYQFIIKGEKYKDIYLKYKNEKKIYFFLTPTYGNLGDQAIELATIEFIKKYFCEYSIINIHLQETFYKMKAVLRTIDSKDLVFIQGGGNFGNLYKSVEVSRRFIVSKIKKNTIIILPSTIYFTNTLKGKIELKRSQYIYNKNHQLVITTREKYSYSFSEKYFNQCKNIMFPDMVFFLANRYKKAFEELDRDRILICFRKDTESVIGSDRDSLISHIYNLYEGVHIIDTQLFRSISDNIKGIEVESMIKEFKSAKLIITDRLHGLIFSIITNTPCIVLPSLDNKIKGTYGWVEKEPQIIFLKTEEINNLDEIIKNMLKIKSIPSSNYNYIFDEFGNEIKALSEE
ncbi:putative pyruvyl transferase EpsI [Schaedlerella arabinosiphila]|nr:putative pyruvyl transferase EpsI [Schaedlerella arabinosiphila]